MSTYLDPTLENQLNEVYYTLAADETEGLKLLTERFLIYLRKNISAVLRLLETAQEIADEGIYEFSPDLSERLTLLRRCYIKALVGGAKAVVAEFEILSAIEDLAPVPRGFACFVFANGLYHQEKYEQAIAMWRKAIDLNPELAQAYNNLGLALSDQGDLPAAIAMYQKAIDLNPEDADAYNNLGIALKDQGDLPAAIAMYQKAIDLNPEYASAYYNLGLALKIQGDLPAAIAMYQKAIDLNPEDATAYDSLGVAFQESGKYDEAKKWHLKAIEINPEYDSPYYNLGCIASLNNDLPEALTHLEKCLSLGYRKFDWIDQDSDWDPIRDTPEFQALLATYRI